MEEEGSSRTVTSQPHRSKAFTSRPAGTDVRQRPVHKEMHSKNLSMYDIQTVG